ncbi:YqaI family protein [Enterococcus dongliensis]|uniref:YqaI family protein n=1 Tax=Enterococcus dongliensis TaxID=2559925 RepID=UPI00288F1C61|nr:hypothetical protein [Enterococcus dongliensis]MDT2670122.1 hypothetical protein [Enterococcus dongliensis]
MTIRDSLGVPQEPDYDEPILKDVYGDDIYENSTVYINADGIVLEENLERYSKEYVEELTAGEANEEIREAMLSSEYSKVIKEALLTWIEDNGYTDYFGLQPKRGEDVIESRRNY